MKTDGNMKLVSRGTGAKFALPQSETVFTWNYTDGISEISVKGVGNGTTTKESCADMITLLDRMIKQATIAKYILEEQQSD